MSFMRNGIIDPTRLYEVKTSSGGSETCKIQCSGLLHTAGTNRTVVAAVTGKKIRVMGLQGCAETAAGYGSIKFLDGSGGTALSSLIYLYKLDQAPPQFWPIADSGYFETTVSTGLYIDVAVNTVNLNVFYITYTP